MTNKYLTKPLGAILQQAGLVSQAQIDVALRDQSQYGHLRLGEILALRGWLKPETADFFAEKLPKLSNQKKKQPLGQYLKEAALLNEHQIATILKLQKQTGLRFGALAVRNGWLKQSTVDFLVSCLVSQPKSNFGLSWKPSSSKLGEYFENEWPGKKDIDEGERKQPSFTNYKHSGDRDNITLKTTPLSREAELIMLEDLENGIALEASLKTGNSYRAKAEAKTITNLIDEEDIPWID